VPSDDTPGAGAWRQSSHCGNWPGCVEVTVTTDTSRFPHKAAAERLYLMRDSTTPDGPALAFTPEEWEAFTLGVKDGEFDLP
jgi:Domain of unknown function (DUF397)